MTDTVKEAEEAIFRAAGLYAHHAGFRAARKALERARASLESLEVQERREGIRARTRRIAAREGLDLADLFGPCRKQHLAYARFEIWYECHRLDGFSFPKIGEVFGRDHSTIIHGVRRWEALLKAARAA